MKRIFNLFALTSAAVFLIGCVEENFENTIKVNQGDEVVFGASASFEKSGKTTKTDYSGDIIDGYERVNWVNGDQVYIYCSHEDGDQSAHYKITGLDPEDSESKNHTATLSKNYDVNPNGINWKDVTKPHTFYAMYPAPNTFRKDQFDEAGNIISTSYSAHLSIDANNVVEGFIPVNQDPISLPTGTARVGKPNMDYAYMIAKQTVNNGVIPEDGVFLSFRPIVTAVEFTLVAQDDVTISNVQIFSTTGAPICGPFTTDLTGYVTNEDYPVCSSGSLTDKYENMNFSSINVSLYERDGDGNPTSASITLSSGQSVTFTVFMLPVDISNLAIRVDAHGYKTANLGNVVSFEAHKKHYVRNLPLPTAPVPEEGEEVKPDGWFEQLDPATFMKGLSIPGSANAFSYHYSTTSDQNYYRTQSKDFETQWNLGVRCFELVSSKAGEYYEGSLFGWGAEWRDYESLASAPIRCNNKQIPNENNPTTIDDAVQMIWNRVNGTNEFAMIIFTYQPTGDEEQGGWQRKPDVYMSQLNAYYNSLIQNGAKVIKYSPSLRAGDCYGKLLLVARPSQEAEDTETMVDSATGTGEILTIKGWGSLPDKWTKRGYQAKLFSGTTPNTQVLIGTGNRYNDYSANAIGYTFTETVEKYIYGKSGDLPSKVNGTQDFEYSTDQIDSDGKPIVAWAQEWRRVYYPTYNANVGGFQWFESLEEKKTDIKDTFSRSISREGNRVYFNSIDGFFMINNAQSYLHYWAGNMGEIKAYAEHMNDWLYKYVLDIGVNNITGPLGVVIMDYIGEGEGGTNLPNIIINNNFKFPLEEDPNYNQTSTNVSVENWDIEYLN